LQISGDVGVAELGRQVKSPAFQSRGIGRHQRRQRC
jgi:hypothetical protein